MAPILRIQLLGEFRLFLDDRPVDTFDQPRLQTLLAYLLLHRHAPQPRQQIAFCFWPDSSEEQAQTNLRKLLFQLRQALPQASEFLYSDHRRLGWRSETRYSLDVAELEQGMNALEQSKMPDLATIERVVTLYRGELLPICYDDWLLPLRRELHERVVNGLTQALGGLETQREYEAGIRCAEHLLRLDPLHEASYRQLMNFRALGGDRAGALRVYHSCARLLEQELGVPPAAETQALYQHLLQVEAQPAAIAPTPQVVQIPLVGRQIEWQTLQQRWRSASQGPHLVLVWGEAGMGKTRLVEELRHWARLRPGSIAYARAYAAEGELAFAPVTTWLRSETLRPALEKLEPVWLTELARLLPELLTWRPDISRPSPMTEGWQRQRFHEALARAMLAAPAPRLLVLDDLQWCDGETLGWLRYLLRFDPQASLVVVGTARTEEVDQTCPLHELLRELQRDKQLTELTLTPLELVETVELAQLIADGDVTPWAEQLYRETEGNPLFVVETVRAGLVESHPVRHDGQLNGLPPTVQAVIATRLAQLSPSAHQLVQLAATIGRAFTFDVLAVASELDEDGLVQGLDELWRRRLVREQATGYDFSHDRIREVAYNQQSRARRRQVHRRIGAALERLYAENLDEVVGELATHAEQAGQIEQAIGYLRRAAELAQTVGAYPEAIARLRKAIALLQSQPLTLESAMQQELAMLVPLGASLLTLRGYGDQEVEAVYQRAHHLCTQLGDDPHLMPTLIGLALFYMIRGELKQALMIGQQGLLLAQRTRDDGLLLEGHLTLGPILLFMGEFRASVTHLEQALTLYDPARHSVHAAVYGQEPGVVCQVILSVSLWFLGYADRSLRLMEGALALAHKVSHEYTLSFAQGFTAYLYHLRQEPASAQVAARAGVELARRQGFQYWLAVSSMFHGWATVRLNAASGKPALQTQESIAQMQEAFAGFKQTGAGLYRGYYLSLIAEAQVATHALDAGLAGLDEALAIMDVVRDRYWLAELHRLRGELLLARVDTAQAAAELEAEAEAAFCRAICTSQAQEARMLELRAATSLARLWMHQGKREQARELLAGIYGWFTEGFDTPDLLAAQRLLTDLAV
jgi:DNA-binding SARP family transcriptional activator/predicted ATPase